MNPMNALSPLAFPSPMDSGSIPSMPHNLEAEQALLGSLMFDNAVFERLSDRLRGSHFYEPFHQRLYEAIEDHIRQGMLAEPTILMERFKLDPAFQEFGGLRYLADLVDRAPPAANAPDYARVVYDLALRRDLSRIGGEIVREAPQPETAAIDQIEQAEQQLYTLAETGKPSSGFVSFSSALSGAVQMAAEAYQRDGKLAGLATHLTDLDSKLGGLHPSDLLVLAGRPSMGKTALVTNIAFNVAKAYREEQQSDGTMKAINGGKVGFFSLEMSAEQLATRILAEQAEISSEKIRRGMINEEEFRRLAAVSQQMSIAPLFIDQTGGITIAQLSARARKLKRQHGLNLLIVDYLQLLAGSSKSSQANRVQEITEITTGLKALAKELSVPIIALSQLSRAVEQREDKRPQLSDLRESGSIEQDADVVMFVFREEYYVERTKPPEGTEKFAEWQANMERTMGKAEVIIGKQRHGPVGTVTLSFEAQFTRFGNLAPGSYQQYDSNE